LEATGTNPGSVVSCAGGPVGVGPAAAPALRPGRVFACGPRVSRLDRSGPVSF